MDAEVLAQHKCMLAAEVLRSSGHFKLRATGTSMLPTLCPGDVLTIESSTFAQVKNGDIVLFSRGGRLFAHRLLETGKKQSGILLARGDCMPCADAPVRPTELLGTVTKIERDYPGLFVPVLPLSPVRRLLGWMLCHFDLLQRAALRTYALPADPGQPFEAAVARAQP